MIPSESLTNNDDSFAVKTSAAAEFSSSGLTPTSTKPEVTVDEPRGTIV